VSPVVLIKVNIHKKNKNKFKKLISQLLIHSCNCFTKITNSAKYSAAAVRLVTLVKKYEVNAASKERHHQ